MKKILCFLLSLPAAVQTSSADTVDDRLDAGLDHMVQFGDPWPYKNGIRYPSNGFAPTGNTAYIPYYAFVLLATGGTAPYTVDPNTPDELIQYYITQAPHTDDQGNSYTGYRSVSPDWVSASISQPEANPPRIQEDEVADPTMLCKAYLRFGAQLSSQTKELIEVEALNFLNAFSQIDPNGSGWNVFDADTTDDWRDNCNNAAKTTWYQTGSENHDMGTFKVGLLLSARVLCESPNYGPGHALVDGHTAGQHYEAWVDYFKRFMRDRAREGINCEIDNPGGYGRTTLRGIYELYDDSGSNVLRGLAGKLLDLYWARSAQEFQVTTGVRAGIATNRLSDWLDYMMGNNWCRYLFYSYDWTDDIMPAEKFPSDEPPTQVAAIYASAYRPPAIVSAIAQASRPPFQATSRHFGRADEDSKMNLMRFDVNGASIRRDTYYTSDYALSGLSIDQTQQTPQLYYTGSRQTRLVGVTFATRHEDRIVIMGDKNGDASQVPADPNPNTPGNEKEHDNYATNTTLSGVNSVVQGDTMIVARDFNAAATTNGGNFVDPGVSAFVSAGPVWDNFVDESATSGWLFTRAGDGYAAMRIANGGFATREYREGANNGGDLRGVFVKLADKWSPVIVQMGRAVDYNNDFEDFKDAVRATTVTYSDGKLTYTSPGGTVFEYWRQSATLPKINGTALNLNPSYAYSSPYLSGVYGQDTATVSLTGYSPYTIDFSSVSNDEFDNGVIPGGWAMTPVSGTSGHTVQTITGANLDPTGQYLEPQDSWLRAAKTGTSGSQCIRNFSAHAAGLVSVEWRFIHLAGKEFHFHVRSNQTPAKGAVNLRIKEYDPAGTPPLGLYLEVHTPGGAANAYTNPQAISTGVPYKVRAVCDTVNKTISIYLDQGSTPFYTGSYDNTATANIARLDLTLDNGGGNQTSDIAFDDLRVLDQD